MRINSVEISNNRVSEMEQVMSRMRVSVIKEEIRGGVMEGRGEKRAYIMLNAAITTTHARAFLLSSLSLSPPPPPHYLLDILFTSSYSIH